MNIYENKTNLGDDGKPYTTLGYANGPGGINGSRENLTGVDTGDKDFLQQATVQRYKETHGLEDVGTLNLISISLSFNIYGLRRKNPICQF